MNAAAERLEFTPPATPGLLRALLLALLAHGLLVAALTWGVQWKRDAQQLSAEAELWAAVPQEAAAPEPPPLPPAAEPVQQPPAPPPEVEPPKVDIALEREKQRLQKQKQLELEKQQEKLQQEKLRQEQLKAEKLKQAQADKAKLAQEKKKAEQETKRLEAQRLQNLQRMAGMAGATGGANASGIALKSAGPSASYAGRIRARIKPNIVFTEELQGNPTAEVEVRTAPDGTIVGRKVTQSSGVKEWDEAVLKAIDKTQVLPRDIDGSMPSALLLVFRPKD
ncbi:MAG: protein TolA [Comamonadaceae bacterium CG17_big_fil_post_rev_8_21_14_2_50_60_13]|nr:MAG: protein TolA [Comamonadaceae bacterium CG17_big_fil_post_rev_8_21_14_2_50_60_13]